MENKSPDGQVWLSPSKRDIVKLMENKPLSEELSNFLDTLIMEWRQVLMISSSDLYSQRSKVTLTV